MEVEVESIFFFGGKMTNEWLIVGLGSLVVWDSRDTPKNPNPFLKGIPGIQTTGTQTNN